MCLAIAAAAFLGGEVGYLIGHKLGPRVFEKKESGLFSVKNVERTNAFFERFGGLAVIVARFVPIVRTFAPVAAGVGHMNYKKYSLYNAIGALIWGAGLTFAGFLLGYIPPVADFVTKYIDVILLAGLNAGEGFLLWVGGHHAQGILDGAPPLYWPEVWGARAFLYVWHDSALPGIDAGLTNQAWRVREMCLKVIATRELALAASVRPLLADENARVRAAAARALGAVGEPSDATAIRELFRDPEIDVRRAAQRAHATLTAR